MNSLRNLTDQERIVILALLRDRPDSAELTESLNSLLVAEMDDGGMGSLMLFPKGSEGRTRVMGRQIVLGEFSDGDGTPVSVALNLDSEGRLFELDVWRVDFNALMCWPKPLEVRILNLNNPGTM